MGKNTTSCFLLTQGVVRCVDTNRRPLNISSVQHYVRCTATSDGRITVIRRSKHPAAAAAATARNLRKQSSTVLTRRKISVSRRASGAAVR